VEENLSFGYWVRRRRKALDLTQAELGRHAGASEAMIRKIEADERRPSRELAERLAVCLAVPDADRDRFLRAARDVLTVETLPPAGASVPTFSPPSHLPARMTSMVNRVRDLAAVTALLLRDDVRLVTLLGPPGMGKTRLSIQVAEQLLPHFPDGVWFVDLAPVTDPALLLPTVAIALGLPPASGLAPAAQLQIGLAGRRLLLVLDNFEQIVDGAALEVAGLLRSTRALKVLATSRVRLDIYGEHEYPLPPMSCPPAAGRDSPDALMDYEAVQLFVTRVRQHRHDFALTDETAAPVAEICRRMDGVPLALELAAARTRRMPVSDLAVALREASGRDWHALLQTSARDLPPRQQTLSNAIRWSYLLLDPPLQRMLAQMSIFAWSFDWPAVLAVVDEPSLSGANARREALERLVDFNLVSQITRAPERWRLLEMIHEFAREQLSDAELQAVSERHARHYATVLAGLLHGTAGKAYQTEVEAVADNCRAGYLWALNAGQTGLAYRFGAAFEWYWEQRGLMAEGRRFLERTLAMPGEVEDDLRYEVLHGAANQAWMQHDLAAAHRHAQTALALARNRGDAPRVSGFLNLQARIYLEEGRYEEADQALVEGIRIEQLLPRRMSPQFMLIQRGEAALGLGRPDVAETLLRAGLEGVPSEDVIPFCVGWTNLAEVALARGDRPAARQALLLVAPLAPLHARRLRVFLTAAAGYCVLEPEGAAETAASLLAYVSVSSERLGDPLSPMTQRALASRIETVRDRLSPLQWRAAWDAGERMTAEEAVALAARTLMDEP
jgi:predicted ATPase/transcriptional regulator with XRE-family HTH domain